VERRAFGACLDCGIFGFSQAVQQGQQAFISGRTAAIARRIVLSPRVSHGQGWKRHADKQVTRSPKRMDGKATPSLVGRGTAIGGEAQERQRDRVSREAVTPASPSAVILSFAGGKEIR
jgi:hypothetical protein